MSEGVKTNLLATVLLVVGSALLLSQASTLWNLNQVNRKQKEEIDDLKAEVNKQTELRAVERAGRISTQRQERENLVKEQLKDGYTYTPIGHVESPFPDRRGTPRQPILVPAAVGRIRFNKQLIQFEHYEELKHFSHVWIIFIFHNNTNTEKANKISKIKPPRLHGVKVGCLSTRSPHRPNNIGLSVCEIVNVTKDFIDIAGIDLVDGTPILDIKPYIPYDMVSSDYVLPMATSADGTTLLSRKLNVPDWVVDSDIVMQPVFITASARETLEEAIREGVCKHYKDIDSLVEFITQVLRQDIRGVHQGRGNLESTNKNTDTGVTNSSVYSCRLDNLNLEFSTTVNGIEINKVTY